MSGSRFHHLSLSVILFVLCQIVLLHFAPLTWQWWLLATCGAYAIQPILNLFPWPWRYQRGKQAQKTPGPYDLIRLLQ